MSAVKSKLIQLGVVVAIAGGVGAYAYWGTFQGSKKEDEKKSTEEKVASFKLADVKGVELNAKGVQYALVADGEGERKWHLTKPLATIGDKATIEGLVNHFADMKRKRTFEAQPADLKNFGLEPPEETVTFKLGDKDVTYLVGKKNGFDDVVYLQRDGDPHVMLVPQAVKTQVDRDLFGLREKRLAIFEDREVSKIDVTIPTKPGYSLEKKGEDWTLVGVGKADKAQVGTLISSVRFLRAKAFAEEHASDLKKYGLDKPVVTVTLHMGDAKTTLLFSEVKEGTGTKRYASQGGDAPILEIGEDMLKKFDVKMSDLRDKQVANVDREQVKKITLTDAGKALVLEKVAPAADAKDKVETWQITAPEQKPAQDAKISNLLYKMNSLRAKEVAFDKIDAASKKSAGLETPAQEITLAKADGTVLAHVAFGAHKGEQLYVTSQGDSRIDLIDKAQVNDVKFEAKDYEKPEPTAAKAPAKP